LQAIRLGANRCEYNERKSFSGEENRKREKAGYTDADTVSKYLKYTDIGGADSSRSGDDENHPVDEREHQNKNINLDESHQFSSLKYLFVNHLKNDYLTVFP